MRTLTTIAFCSAATLGLAGCEGENLFANSDPVVANDRDIFDAVVLEFVDPLGDRIDLIAEGGRFELALDEDAGEFESDFEFRDVLIGVTGTFFIEDDNIVFSDDPFEDDDLVLERSFDFVDEGDVLFLSDPAAVFDVDNDGSEEVVEMQVRLEARD